MTTTEQVLADLDEQVRDLRNARPPHLARRSSSAPGTVTLPAAWAADPAGPTLAVPVGPSGQLAVTATAALTAGAGATAVMSWQLAGPYLDAAASATPHGVTATTIDPDPARGLAVTAGAVTASYVWEHDTLAPGWWLLSARYRVTGGSGTATARQLMAAPL